MERRKFEDEMKHAFRGAEVEPSENVWNNIELDLEREDGNALKRKVFFYKMLAAASIAFAICVAGIGYYTGTQQQFNNSDHLAVGKAGISPNEVVNDDDHSKEFNLPEKTYSEDQIPQPSLGMNEKNSTLLHGTNDPENRVQRSGNTAGAGRVAKLNDENNQPIESGQGESLILTSDASLNRNSTAAEDVAINEKGRILPKLYTKTNPSLIFPEQESTADPVALMFAKLNDLERELSEKRDEKRLAKNEKLWTSVGFAAGGFNAVNPSVTPRAANATLMSSASSVADNQSKASGIAYSAGISIGGSIAKRWVLQGGVNYMSQLSDYTATEAFGSPDLQKFKPFSLNEFRATESQLDNRVISTPAYTVNNNVQFISMPVQAGYLIVNKKLGWQFNAGVATDLFLQNTIDAEGGSLDKTTQSRGDDSPYRSVNFSGLIGTELSYKFGQRYRVALNPGVRYPFNSIYKSDLGIESNPLTIDVGLRFRYIFQ